MRRTMACRENNKKYRKEETTSPLVSGVLERCWAREGAQGEQEGVSREPRNIQASPLQGCSVRAPSRLRVMRLSKCLLCFRCLRRVHTVKFLLYPKCSFPSTDSKPSRQIRHQGAFLKQQPTLTVVQLLVSLAEAILFQKSP